MAVICKLCDFPLQGGLFIWSGRQNGQLESTIDCFLTSKKMGWNQYHFV